jgi:hypothetical protein
MELEQSITKQTIRKEVLRVGLMVFLITAIIPIIHTICFLALVLPDIIVAGLGYAERSQLNYLILDWLIVVLPFTIPAIVGKRLLFTDNKKSIYWMPFMTIVIAGFIVAIAWRWLLW